MVERRIPRQRQGRSELNPASGGDRGTVFSRKPLSPTERASREENEWLSGIMKEHGQILVKYFVRRTGGDVDKAEDIVQQVLVKAWQNKDKLNKKGIRAWLFTVGRNILIDEVRAVHARPPEVLYEPERHDRESNDNVPEPVETDMVITDALKGLSLTHREVLVAFYRDGLSYKEIAEKDNITIGTVKSRLHYAVDSMRGVFRQMGVDASIFS